MGKKEVSMKFKGENNIHSTKFNLFAKPYENISSSNPTFINISSSFDKNETDNSFAYISEILLHDNNLNVVGKAHLSEPVIMRSGDKIKFSFSYDW
jgi:hypothetical protein